MLTVLSTVSLIRRPCTGRTLPVGTSRTKNRSDSDSGDPQSRDKPEVVVDGDDVDQDDDSEDVCLVGGEKRYDTAHFNRVQSDEVQGGRQQGETARAAGHEGADRNSYRALRHPGYRPSPPRDPQVGEGYRR